MKLLKYICATAVLSVSSVAFSQNKPVTLVYNYPVDPVHYVARQKVVEVMDVNGESMNIEVSSSLGCTIKAAGSQDKGQKLEILTDSMSQYIVSPQGTAGGKIDVTGKSFTTLLPPDGKNIDFAEARKIILNVEGSGPTDLSQSYWGFFPSLPDKPIKPGDTWTSKDTVDIKAESITLHMIISSDFRFDGYEDVSGISCAKISSTNEGTREMKNQAQGMDLKTSGSFSGTSTLWFAPDKGYYVKNQSSSKMKGQIEIVSPDNMSFPVVMDITSLNELK